MLEVKSQLTRKVFEGVLGMPAVLTLRRILTFLSKGLSLHINKDVVHSHSVVFKTLSQKQNTLNTHIKKTQELRATLAHLKAQKVQTAQRAPPIPPPSLPFPQTSKERRANRVENY